MSKRPIRTDQRIRRDLDDQERAVAAQEDGASDRGLPASKKYKVDPKFSRTPTAICGNTTIGIPTCEKGEGKFCYCRIPCSSQMEEDCKTRTKAAQKLYEEEASAALKHAREIAEKDPFLRDGPEDSIEEVLRYYTGYNGRQ